MNIRQNGCNFAEINSSFGERPDSQTWAICDRANCIAMFKTSLFWLSGTVANGPMLDFFWPILVEWDVNSAIRPHYLRNVQGNYLFVHSSQNKQSGLAYKNIPKFWTTNIAITRLALHGLGSKFGSGSNSTWSLNLWTVCAILNFFMPTTSLVVWLTS